MVQLPAVEHVGFAENDTLQVYVGESLASQHITALKNVLRGIPGVAGVRVRTRPQFTSFIVVPEIPALSRELMTAVKAAVKPRLPYTIGLYLGPIRLKKGTLPELLCAAVEFLEPVEPAVFDRILAAYVAMVNTHNGPATIHHRHPRFFVFTFEYHKKDGSKALTKIAAELGMYVSIFHPISAPLGFNPSVVTEQLLGQYS